VDLYFEAVKRQITSVKNKLQKKRDERALHRLRRRDLGFFSVSLAGYTNAGKSSLFNFLTKETVPIDNGLFTTLSTTTRAIRFYKRRVLLTDTVGFIDRLPLKLIKAFHSTLEETIFADLIILVADLSEPVERIKNKISCSLKTIQQIGASEIPIITALNKIDLLKKDELNKKISILKDITPNPIPISTIYETNMKKLRQEISSYLQSFIEVQFSLPISNDAMSLISQLFDKTYVKDIEYRGKNINVLLKTDPIFMDRIKGQIEKLGGKFDATTKSSNSQMGT
jgi:GTP-binding protein HflX